MARKAKPVKLKKSEKKQLEDYVSKGTRSARAIKRARILLLSHEKNTNDQIVDKLGASVATICRVRKRYFEEGMEYILSEKPRSGQPSKIDSEVEAKLTMLACSEAPDGHARWTLRMLADKLVELNVVDSISHTHVATMLKKTNLNLG